MRQTNMRRLSRRVPKPTRARTARRLKWLDVISVAGRCARLTNSVRLVGSVGIAGLLLVLAGPAGSGQHAFAADSQPITTVTPGASSLSIAVTAGEKFSLDFTPVAGSYNDPSTEETDVTAPCTNCSYSWPIPTGIGLRGGDTYGVSPANCAQSCPVVEATRISIAGSYCRPLPEVSETALPDGGTTRTFSDEQSSSTQEVPPSGFSPLTASDAELALYGYPPRPASGAELSKWDADFANYRGTSSWSPCVQDDVGPGLGTATSSSAVPSGVSPNSEIDTTSPTWSGQVTDVLTGSHLTYVEGDYVQRKPEPTSCTGTPYAQAVWTGFGGFEVSAPYWNLMQDGTQTDYNNPNSVFPWYQEITVNHTTGTITSNTGQIKLGAAGSITYADHLLTWVYYYSNTLYYEVYDSTSGTAFTAQQTGASTYYDNPIEGDAVAERPTLAGTASEFEQLGSDQNEIWTYTEATTSGGTSQHIGQFNHWAISMLPSGSGQYYDAYYNGGYSLYGVDWSLCGPTGHS